MEDLAEFLRKRAFHEGETKIWTTDHFDVMIKKIELKLRKPIIISIKLLKNKDVATIHSIRRAVNSHFEDKIIASRFAGPVKNIALEFDTSKKTMTIFHVLANNNLIKDVVFSLTDSFDLVIKGTDNNAKTNFTVNDDLRKFRSGRFSILFSKQAENIKRQKKRKKSKIKSRKY